MPVIERVWTSGKRKVKRTAWGYTVQIGGKQVRHFDAAWSKDDAQNALAARLMAPEAPKVAPAPTIITFKQMTDRYLQEKEVSRPETVEYDRSIITRMVAYFGATAPLTAITAPRIADYRIGRLTTKSERTKRRLAPASVNRELAILRAVLRLAADEECGYLEKAPKVKMERAPEGRLRFLSEDEEGRLLAECRKAAEHPVAPRRSSQLYPIVVVALNTGMRKGEIMSLEWAHSEGANSVDFSRGVFVLEKTKSKRRREIPMNQAVYDVLSALPRKGPRLFRGSVRKAFESAVERAGVKDFHFHDLRHSFASRLAMKGRTLLEIQKLLGHSSVTQTERYSHLAPERLRDAVATLEVSTTSAQSLPAAVQVPATITEC